jgi:septal ring factor EnvC (AmiA/AmiB activator)
MRFWKWLQGKNKVKPDQSKRSKPLDPKITQAFTRVKKDIKIVKTGLAELSRQLNQQANTLTENTRFIHDHNARLDKLEKLVIETPVMPIPEIVPTNRPNEPTNRLVATKTTEKEPSEKLDMQGLSEQEKRIMGIFLAHRDMPLSYQDIAKSLNKSPHTIKNQIRQLNMKSSLFDKTVDAQNKNRFKLKKHLKIESDLDAY